MKNPSALSRRSFICTAMGAGGGLMIGLRFAAPVEAPRPVAAATITGASP